MRNLYARASARNLPTKNRLDMINVRAALIGRAAQIATAMLGEPNRSLSSRRELRFGRRGSASVVISGAKAGHWFDHENGEGGDLLRLIQREQGGGFLDAVRYAERFIGTVPTTTTSTSSAPTPAPRDDVEECERTRRALRIWDEAKPVSGTAAALYLERRGVLEPGLAAGDGVLRFHPDCPFGEGTRRPCLIALMQDMRTDEPRAIQRTALDPNAQKIGRMTLGPKTSAAIKLSADENVTAGLAVGEGVETVLAGMLLGFQPAWALVDANAVEKFPALAGIGALTILVDHDEGRAGQNAALKCSARWTAAGREVTRVTPDILGEDINNVIESGSAA